MKENPRSQRLPSTVSLQGFSDFDENTMNSHVSSSIGKFLYDLEKEYFTNQLDEKSLSTVLHNGGEYIYSDYVFQFWAQAPQINRIRSTKGFHFYREGEDIHILAVYPNESWDVIDLNQLIKQTNKHTLIDFFPKKGVKKFEREDEMVSAIEDQLIKELSYTFCLYYLNKLKEKIITFILDENEGIHFAPDKKRSEISAKVIAVVDQLISTPLDLSLDKFVIVIQSGDKIDPERITLHYSLMKVLALVSAAIFDDKAYSESRQNNSNHRLYSLIKTLYELSTLEICNQGKRHELVTTLNRIHPKANFIEDLNSFLENLALNFIVGELKKKPAFELFSLLKLRLQSEIDPDLPCEAYDKFLKNQQAKVIAHLQQVCQEHGLAINDQDQSTRLDEFGGQKASSVDQAIKDTVSALIDLPLPLDIDKPALTAACRMISLTQEEYSDGSEVARHIELFEACKTFDEIKEKGLIEFVEKRKVKEFIRDFFAIWFSEGEDRTRYFYYKRVFYQETKDFIKMSDEKIQKIFKSKKRTENGNIIEISPYEINWILLYAISHPVNQWTPIFSTNFREVLLFLQKMHESSDDQWKEKAISRDSYSAELINHLEFLWDWYEHSKQSPWRLPSLPNQFLFPLALGDIAQCQETSLDVSIAVEIKKVFGRENISKEKFQHSGVFSLNPNSVSSALDREMICKNYILSLNEQALVDLFDFSKILAIKTDCLLSKSSKEFLYNYINGNKVMDEIFSDTQLQIITNKIFDSFLAKEDALGSSLFFKNPEFIKEQLKTCEKLFEGRFFSFFLGWLDNKLTDSTVNKSNELTRLAEEVLGEDFYTKFKSNSLDCLSVIDFIFMRQINCSGSDFWLTVCSHIKEKDREKTKAIIDFLELSKQPKYVGYFANIRQDFFKKLASDIFAIELFDDLYKRYVKSYRDRKDYSLCNPQWFLLNILKQVTTHFSVEDHALWELAFAIISRNNLSAKEKAKNFFTSRDRLSRIDIDKINKTLRYFPDIKPEMNEFLKQYVSSSALSYEIIVNISKVGINLFSTSELICLLLQCFAKSQKECLGTVSFKEAITTIRSDAHLRPLPSGSRPNLKWDVWAFLRDEIKDAGFCYKIINAIAKAEINLLSTSALIYFSAMSFTSLFYDVSTIPLFRESINTIFFHSSADNSKCDAYMHPDLLKYCNCSANFPILDQVS